MDDSEDVSSQNESLFEKVETQEKEIERLNAEVVKLRKCVRGVTVLGRALKETKEENKRLQGNAQLQSSDGSQIPYEPNANDADDDDIDITGLSISTQDMDDIDEFSGSDINNDSGNECREEHEDVKSKQEVGTERKDDKWKHVDLRQRERKQEGHADDGNVDKEVTNSSHDKSDMVKSAGDLKTHAKTSNSQVGTDDTIRVVIEGSKRKSPENTVGSSEHPPESSVNSVKSVAKQEAGVKQERGDTTSQQQQACETDTDNEETWKNRCEKVTKENVGLKQELHKIVKVNNEWDTFWNTKRAALEKELAEKDDRIVKLEKFKNEHGACGKASCTVSQKDSTENESEKMSLLTTQHVANLEALVQRQQSDLNQERQKCERAQKLARSLLQQNKELNLEVKRLNGTLETKVELQKSLQQLSSSGLSSLAGVQRHANDDVPIVNGEPVNKESPNKQTTSRDLMPPIDMRKLEQTQFLKSGLEYQQQQGDQQQQQEPENQETANDDDNLTVEELKERIMILKEQKNAYESDFRKERRDREDVVGELDKMKEKLEKTKHKLKHRKQVTHQAPFPNGSHHVKKVPGHHVYAPGTYYYPPHERNQLIAHGVQQDYYWYDPHNNQAVGEEPPCLCPRYHNAP